jgi:large subunit ribosomal protein L15e
MAEGIKKIKKELISKPSSKGAYHYIKQAWKKPDKDTLRKRMIEWRKGNRIVKVEKPLRLDRARNLGYKAKKGFVVARVSILRGGRKRPRLNKKRRTKGQSVKKVLKMNYKWVAESRAQRKFKNLEVLNSYNIGKDGKFYFFEVILVDPERPEIKNNKSLKFITEKKNRYRVLRGLTSAAKKSRGLRKKSHELKVRPSSRAQKRKGK